MSLKWLRNYRLKVQSLEDGIDIVIESPITLQFSIVRNRMASLNSANFAIYNLARETYKDIFQDRFGYYQGVNGQLAYRRVTLEVGYGGEYFEIFRGNLFQARTQRQGSNLITLIDARDGGFDTATTKTFQTYAGGSVRGLLLNLIGEFPNLNIGAIGEVDGELKRPVTINANTWEAIKLYSNNSVFVDMETLHILQPNEVIQVEGDSANVETGLAPLISSATGLLGVPRKEDAYITVDTLLEPRIVMGQYVKLESDILPVFNGVYAVVSVKHEGIISGAVGGECKSTFGLFVTEQYYGKLKTVKPGIERVNLEAPQ